MSRKHRSQKNIGSVTPTINQTRVALSQEQQRSRIDFWGDAFNPRRFDTLGLKKKLGFKK